jgi:uncharacterized protein (DUF427 family)
VVFNGIVVAESCRALVLHEGRYSARAHYVPSADVGKEYLRHTGYHSYCPHKGETSYWTLCPSAD